MIKLAKKYPNYNWNKNFGYGTKAHFCSLRKYGVTKHHRKNFKPIHNMLVLASN
jgi:ribonuclease HII